MIGMVPAVEIRKKTTADEEDASLLRGHTVEMTAGPASVNHKSKKDSKQTKMVQGVSVARNNAYCREVAKNMKTLAKHQGVLPCTSHMINGKGYLPHESKQTGTVLNTGQVLGVSKSKDVAVVGDDKTGP